MITKIGLDEQEKYEHPFLGLGGAALGGVTSQQLLGNGFMRHNRYEDFVRQKPESAKEYFKNINAREQKLIDKVNAKHQPNYLAGIDDSAAYNRDISRVRSAAENMRKNKWNNAVRARTKFMWVPGALTGLIGGNVAGKLIDEIRN